MQVRENGREELAFPAPRTGFRPFRAEYPRHMSPVLAEEIAFLRARDHENEEGERPQSATQLRKWCRPQKPAANPVTPLESGFAFGPGNTVGSKPGVATVSQCGGFDPGGFGQNERRRKVPDSQTERESGRIHHGVSATPETR